MKTYKLKTEPIATTQNVWMGIDVHKVSLHITILDEEGEQVWAGSVPHGREHVAGLVRRLETTQITAVYEAGPTGYKLKHWLEELGCEAFICPPTHVRQRQGRKRIKTDARDSYDLAEQARAGMLPAIHDLGEENYHQREVLRTRGQLVKHRQQLKAQIKSELLYHSVCAPEGLKANWSKAYLNWLEQGPSESGDLNLTIHCLLRTIETLDLQIKRLDARLRKLAKSQKWKKKAELLQSIPGVGLLTAMAVLLEAGDISRFDRCEEFASWLGLVPSEWSSGEGTRKGSITRAGNRRIRTALVESCWTLIRHDEAMNRTYERIKHRRNGSIAVVAVARRLALIIRAILRDEKPYDYAPVK